MTTRIELQKRYSGTFLGALWIPIYPLLFLSVYLFVYLVVFRVKFPGFSELDYVIYVFSGLVPYIAFMECMTGGAQSVRQNIHLIKNVVMPIELVPIRVVATSMVTFGVGLLLSVILIVANGSLSAEILLLPLALALFLLFLVGLANIMSALGVILPDINQFTNLLTLLLIFVSPIGFKPDMVPSSMSFMVYLNPVFYMMAPFRAVTMGWETVGSTVISLSTLMSVVTFAVGSVFFNRFKNFLVDYE